MSTQSNKNTKCRMCNSKNLVKFLSLGNQPLANAFLTEKELKDKEPRYPLEAYLCLECNLAQLIDVVPKEVMFSNYVYFTAGMPKISNHFKQYAEYVIQHFLKNKNDLIVEIGSNDGILLEFFKDKGYRVQGIDPAENVIKVAISKGIPTICDFFNEKIAADVKKAHGTATAILANNVVAHIDNHTTLFNGVSELLKKEGVFVFEAPYLVDMFKNLTYDTIYHEHLSFLSVRPLVKSLSSFGLEIFNVQLFPVQGQSIRVFAGHKGEHKIKNSVKGFVDAELAMGLDNLDSYKKLAERVAKSTSKLIKKLNDLKHDGKKIAIYGAPAKGNTLLNYAKIGPDIVDYALDELPSKHNLYTPGMHIKVVDKKYAISHKPDYYLLLAWNYRNAIIEKEAEYIKNGGKFIIPVGDEIDII